MAIQVHSPRGIRMRAGSRFRAGPARGSGRTAWPSGSPPGGGQDLMTPGMARAAELLLARALKIAPEAEVHSGPPPGLHADPPPTAEPRCRRRPLRRTPRRRTTAAPPAPAVGRPGHPGVRGPCRGRGAAGRPAGGADRRRIQAAAPPCGELLAHRQPGELRLFLESFDSSAAASRSIDVYVGRVRRKLRRGRHAIATVRGGGYQFVPGPRAKVRGPAEYSI